MVAEVAMPVVVSGAARQYARSRRMRQAVSAPSAPVKVCASSNTR